MHLNFIRRGISSPLRFQGKIIPFQDLGADVGFLQIEVIDPNQPLIAMLSNYAAQKLGGVVIVSDEQLEVEKKASSDEQLRLQLLAAQSPQFNPSAQSVRVAATSDPFAPNPVQMLPSQPAPVAVRVDPAPGDGMIHGTQVSYPVPITTEQYKALHLPKAADVVSEASKAALSEEPTLAKVSDLVQ